MGYGIMRTEKRQKNDLYKVREENNRTFADHAKPMFADKRINWSRTDSNLYFRKTENWNDAVKDLLEEKGIKRVRKDAVYSLDTIYTASPDFFEGKTTDEVREFFERCLEYHGQELCGGHDELIINAVIHFDETTPHMHVVSVPLVEKDGKWKLSAKDLMGNATAYRKRQDCFYEQVSKGYGLDRGETRENGEERKRHKEQNQFYAEQMQGQIAVMEKAKKKKEAEIRDYDLLLGSQKAQIRSQQAMIERQREMMEQLTRQKKKLVNTIMKCMTELDQKNREQTALQEEFLAAFPGEKVRVFEQLKEKKKEINATMNEIRAAVEEARQIHSVREKYEKAQEEDDFEK